MSRTFDVEEDGVIPEWVRPMLRDSGVVLEVLTEIGWIKLVKSDADFRNSLTYRVREEA